MAQGLGCRPGENTHLGVVGPLSPIVCCMTGQRGGSSLQVGRTVGESAFCVKATE